MSEPGPIATIRRRDPKPAVDRASGLPDGSLAVVAAAVCLTLLGGGGFEGAGAVAAVVVLIGVTVVAIRAHSANRDERLLIGSAALFALVWTIAAVGWGSGLSGARGLAVAALSLPATWLVARRLSSVQAASMTRWVVRGAAIVSALALVGLMQRASGWAYASPSGARAAGTLSYPNAFGLLLAIAAPLVAVQLRRAQTSMDQRWARAALFLLVAALTTTMSRGAAVALVVAIVVLAAPVRRSALLIGVGGGLAALPLVGTATSDAPSILVAVPLVVGLVAVVVAPRLERRVAIAVALAAGVMLVGVSLSTRLAGVAGDRLAMSNLDARTPEWSAAIDQMISAPLLGVGPEQPMVVADPRDGHEYWSRFAHNEVLQVAGGAGLVGAALLGLYGHRLVRLLRGGRGAHAAGTALAFGVGGIVDFSWHFPVIAMVTGLMLGLNPPESEHR
ncbi:MAG: O-antigen ligase family protein [Microthrixaceae bacterium]